VLIKNSERVEGTKFNILALHNSEVLQDSQTDKAIINETRRQLKKYLIWTTYHKHYYKANQGGLLWSPNFALVDEILFINYENKQTYIKNQHRDISVRLDAASLNEVITLYHQTIITTS